MNSSAKVKAIAFYLPQYHPIPENDNWWGKGFTEWTNVTKAKPQFKGHYQPHLPADLGFYDLRLPEVRQAQAELAKSHGIYGFCYYHYWFNGKRLLNRPFDEVLASGQPDFPFCLCWANENWTRRWDGKEQELLIAQNYSEADDIAHIRWLAKAFQDPRYIRITDKPLFLVYRASKLPDSKKTTALWRQEAHRLGIGDLFLCNVESFYTERSTPISSGFDASVEFQPDWTRLGPPLKKSRLWKILRKLGITSQAFGENKVYDYSSVVEHMMDKPSPNYLRFPCVTPSWDNTSRRKQNAVIFHASTPTMYQYWLESVVRRTLSASQQEPFVFINAWNEWAEGNHLEPCQKWGHAYLDATAKAIQGIQD